MSKAPAFQFYPKDFLEGTAEMSNAEAGAYIKLLCHQWLKEGLKNDDKILTRFCNGDNEGLEVAKEKFELKEDGFLRNERLEKTRRDQIEFNAAKKEAGKRGAEKRWQTDSKPIANEWHTHDFAIPSANVLPLANGMAKDSSASSSSSTNKSSSSFDVFEIMRRQLLPTQFSDAYVKEEALSFARKYRNKDIRNAAALISTWVSNMKPDIQPKKFVN